MDKLKAIRNELKSVENMFIASTDKMLGEAFKPNPSDFTCLDRPGKVMTIDGREVIVF